MADSSRERTEPSPRADPVRFRDAMSRVAAAVHIVTTDGPAGLAGITASAVSSVTAEPPMMLFCVNKSSASAARFLENGVFCINTLKATDEALSNVFAGRTDLRLDDRFSNGDWAQLSTGAPVLKSAVAAFDCRVAEVKEMSTHYIVFGIVEAVEYGTMSGSLTYIHREYRTV